MTISIDDTWKHQGCAMYYKDPKRWVCLDCDYDTKSPYGASCHAADHGFTLPNHRKDKSVKTEVPLQLVKKQTTEEYTEQLEPEILKKEEKFNSHTLWPLYKNVQKLRFSPKIEPESDVSREMRYKLEMAKSIQALQMTSTVTPEYLEELKIKYGLKEKPQLESNNNDWMMFMVLQNMHTKPELSFTDMFWNALEKATFQKIKEDILAE